MQRREFIKALSGAATAWPLRVNAQSAGKIPRVGWIILGSPGGGFADIFSYYDSFRAGLSELGYVEGKNIILIERSALGVPEALPGLIDDLLRENVSVIISPGPAIRVIREKVKSTPVVFAFSGDPVAAGFVDTLAHGKGNLTGLSYMAVELNGKRLDLMREMLPDATNVTLLTNPIHPGEHLEVAEYQRVAAALGTTLPYLQVRNPTEWE
jgi:putative ABC transport system substrate-binding protein